MLSLRPTILAAFLVATLSSVVPSGTASAQTPASGNPSVDWFTAALEMTGRWETSREGDSAYAATTGDSDEQGISVGILQWNPGQGSIAKLLATIAASADQEAKETHNQALSFDAIVRATMPDFTDFVTEMRASGARGLQYARAHQSHFIIDREFDRQLQAFLSSSASIRGQKILAGGVSDNAYRRAKQLADATKLTRVPFAYYAYYFDLITEGGEYHLEDLKNILANTAELRGDERERAFRRYAMSASGLVLLRDWAREEYDAAHVGADPDELFGRVDCHKQRRHRTELTGATWDAAANCETWRAILRAQGDEPHPENMLLTLTLFRAIVSRDSFAMDVFNRKGTMAMGVGFVHGTYCDWRGLYQAMDRGLPYARSMLSNCRNWDRVGNFG